MSVVVVTPTLVSVVTPTLALAFLSLPETTPLSDANFVGFLPVGLYPLKVAKAFFISAESLISRCLLINPITTGCWASSPSRKKPMQVSPPRRE